MNVIPAQARWVRPESVSREMITETKRYFFDSGDAWAGRKLGRSYGTLFRISQDGTRITPVRWMASGDKVVEIKNYSGEFA